ncbi:MAG: hypothetical protein H6728_01660 [Myxococcales bacterium]|nr:hypothetical protein [Myxococcales bacterium]
MAGTTPQFWRGVASVNKFLISAGVTTLAALSGSDATPKTMEVTTLVLASATTVTGIAASLMKRDYHIKQGTYVSEKRGREFVARSISSALKIVGIAVGSYAVAEDDKTAKAAALFIGVAASMASSAKFLYSVPRRITKAKAAIEPPRWGF